MATAMGSLGNLVPAFAPQPAFDGPLPAIQPAAAEVLGGATLSALTEARVAVTQHWSDAIDGALDVMQNCVEKLRESIQPSWKEHLSPSATWLGLINSCGTILGNTDGEVIMASYNQAKKARSGMSQAPVSALSPPQQPRQHVRPLVSTAQDVSTSSPSRVAHAGVRQGKDTSALAALADRPETPRPCARLRFLCEWAWWWFTRRCSTRAPSPRLAPKQLARRPWS
jgi:hypothetical protein